MVRHIISERYRLVSNTVAREVAEKCERPVGFQIHINIGRVLRAHLTQRALFTPVYNVVNRHQLKGAIGTTLELLKQ